MNYPIRERNHRLSLECYRCLVKVHFTLCIKGKATVFTNQEVFQNMQQRLLNELSHYRSAAEVYLFMPDHGHILLSGTTDDADVYRCITAFKQQSGYWLSKELPEHRWQKDFYDHILRKDEDTEKVVWYILNNPIRKELVNDWKLYPYKGSTVYNFNEW